MLRRFGDGRERRIIETLHEHGLSVDVSPEHFVRGKLARSWYDEHVIPKLDSFDFWGVKEVFLGDAENLIDTYKPHQLVLIWRDPRDVALSLLELMNRSLMSFADRKTLKDEAWALECIRESAETLSQLAAVHPHFLVRYEDLMTSSSHRQTLLEFVGLSSFSNVSLALKADKSSARNPEVLLHDERFSCKSVNRFTREPPGWRNVFARICHVAIALPSTQAGYGESDSQLKAMSATPTKSLSVRTSDPHYEPGPEFDFAYARRRARRKVAPLLPADSSVIDVGATTAALAYLAPHARVTAVDDMSPGKQLLSRPWREGVLPALKQFDTATFLFSLEYLADPLRYVAHLLKRQLRVIITYHCTDDFPLARREVLDFKSHLSRNQWKSFASSQAVPLACDWAFDGFQSLLRFEPSNSYRA